MATYYVIRTENNGMCQYRHPNNDCPQRIGTDDPRQSARDFFNVQVRYACDMLRGYPLAYIEVVNECYYGDDQHPQDYYWWAQWIDEMITLATDYQCPKVILPTLGPGHGTPRTPRATAGSALSPPGRLRQDR